MRSLLMFGSAFMASSPTTAFKLSPTINIDRDVGRSYTESLPYEDLSTSRRRHVANTCMIQPTRATPAKALKMSTTETEATVAGATEYGASEEGQGVSNSEDIPTSLPSEAGIDYVPLAMMLATGDLKGADQFTRDALIKAAGAGSQKRDFVYWTEVKKIPNTDLATMDNLWLRYSKGKFGYSVQREIWRRAKGNFEKFCRRIGWSTKDSEVERKLRWFGANEFIYDVDKAPRGHLPLTSALRGTTLLKELMEHPVWETASQENQ